MQSYKQWKLMNESILPSFNLGLGRPSNLGITSQFGFDEGMHKKKKKKMKKMMKEGIQEDIDALLSGENLSEDFATKALETERKRQKIAKAQTQLNLLKAPENSK